MEIVLRLVLGSLFGGIIGFERQAHGRPAGFRTHLLVCLASVLIMIVSVDYYKLLPLQESIIRIDPARIAAGAITGVGFLGAGVIIKSGFTIQGLTTAACLWMVSAIGLAVGSGLYLYSSVAFLITLFSLWVLRKVERHVPRLHYKVVSLIMETTEVIDFREALRVKGVDIPEVDFELDQKKGETLYTLHTVFRDRSAFTEAIRILRTMEGLKRLHIRGG